MNTNNGFTLTEIMVVTIVVGLLAAIALPKYSTTVEKSRSGEAVQILKALLDSQLAYYLEKGSYANSVSSLEVNFNTPKYFNAPTLSATDTTKLVSVASVSGGYTFSIGSTGTIICAESTSGICAKLGCNRGGGANQCP